MEQDFIKPFLTSTTNVLVTMASVASNAGGSHLKTEDLPSTNICGIIPLQSEKTQGTIKVSFSEPVILHIAEKMLGEKFSQINEQVTDLVGEIANMVAGDAKPQLLAKGYAFEMDVPRVSLGDPLIEDSQIEQRKAVIIPFSTSAGEFYVELSFKTER